MCIATSAIENALKTLEGGEYTGAHAALFQGWRQSTSEASQRVCTSKLFQYLSACIIVSCERIFIDESAENPPIDS